MNESHDDLDRWVDVLAGREPPSDRGTREAAGIRDVVTRRIERDLKPTAPNAARQARLEQRLAQAGLLKATPAPEPAIPAAPPAGKGWLQTLRDWLWPEGGGPMRLGLVAAALAAVVALPLLMPGDEPDDSLRMRAPVAVPGALAPVPQVPELRVPSIDPLQDARRVQSALQSQGLAVRLGVGADDVVVSAEVSAAQRDTVAGSLAAQGLRLSEGQVHIRFVRQP